MTSKFLRIENPHIISLSSERVDVVSVRSKINTPPILAVCPKPLLAKEAASRAASDFDLIDTRQKAAWNEPNARPPQEAAGTNLTPLTEL